MSRSRAFFLEEATECLRVARSELERQLPDRTIVYKAVRRLRGSAQLARFGTLAVRAGVLERRLRTADRERVWTPELSRTAASGLEELHAAVERVRAGEMNPDHEMERTMAGEARSDGEVGIAELEYRGQAALERALELREALEDAILSDAPAGSILDELFDLIRLGMK